MKQRVRPEKKSPGTRHIGLMKTTLPGRDRPAIRLFFAAMPAHPSPPLVKHFSTLLAAHFEAGASTDVLLGWNDSPNVPDSLAYLRSSLLTRILNHDPATTRIATECDVTGSLHASLRVQVSLVAAVERTFGDSGVQWHRKQNKLGWLGMTGPGTPIQFGNYATGIREKSTAVVVAAASAPTTAPSIVRPEMQRKDDD